jgi:hypothetical protein
MDRTVRRWGPAADLQKAVLAGHTDTVFDAAFSPHAQRLAAATEDGVVKIWSVEGGRELATLLSPRTTALYQVVFSADGAGVAATAGFSTVRFWRIP